MNAIVFTLLGLYSLPLFVLLVTFIVTAGFSEASVWSEFAISLSGIYLSPLRDTLGTFAVPFITAYAVTTVQKDTSVAPDTLRLFYTLVLLLVVAITTYCVTDMRVSVLLSQLMEGDADKLEKFKERLLGISSAYVKELLVYISLLLGITGTKRREP
jgi:hypothetical protein